MQNNRTLRSHFSSIRLTKIQKFDDVFWWQVCGNQYPLHYSYESNSTAPVEGNWQQQAKLQMRWPWDVAVLVIAICSEDTVPVAVQLLSRVRLFATQWITARPPCPWPTPGVHPNSCPSSWWSHPAISSSVVPFSSCPQSLPASGSFPTSQLFTSGG